MAYIDKITLEINESVKEYGYISNSAPIWQNISILVDACMVPGLSEPYDDLSKPKPSKDECKSLQISDTNLADLEKLLLHIFQDKELQRPFNPEFMSSMILLVEQMTLNGPWSHLYNNSYSKNIVEWFETYNIATCYGSDESYKENVFVICMRKIHTSLTQDKWKQYPAHVESYRSIITKMTKSGKVTCPLHIAFPATLMQLDDHHTDNRLEGLKCCQILLNNLNFTKTGYEDVVYDTIMKLLLYKDTAILSELLNCVLAILPIYINKDDSQWTKCDDMFEVFLDAIYMESDSIRKSIYLKYLPHIMNHIGNSVIRWKKKILKILCDGMDIYLHRSQDHTNINSCIKCLVTWIKIGWPVWSYPADHTVLVRLFKLLYLCCDDEVVASNVDMEELERCIVSILCLYTEPQRYEVFDQSEVNIIELGVKFGAAWNSIKDKVLDENETNFLSNKISLLNISTEKTLD